MVRYNSSSSSRLLEVPYHPREKKLFSNHTAKSRKRERERQRVRDLATSKFRRAPCAVPVIVSYKLHLYRASNRRAGTIRLFDGFHLVARLRLCKLWRTASGHERSQSVIALLLSLLFIFNILTACRN